MLQNNNKVIKDLKILRPSLKLHSDTSGRDDLGYAPVIDTIAFQHKTANSTYPVPRFFSQLVEQAPTTPLMKHFAFCEQNGLEYTIPKTNIIVFKATYRKVFVKMGKVKISILVWQYSTFTSWLEIISIFKFDPLFFLVLLPLLKNFEAKLIKFHLAYDLTKEIMTNVEKDVRKGRLQTFGARAVWIGLQGSQVFKALCGAQSKFVKERGDINVTCHTLYSGHWISLYDSVILYNKKEKAAQTHQDTSFAQTRIEVRFNFNPTSDNQKKLTEEELDTREKDWNTILTIVKNYLNPKGYFYYCDLFLKVIEKRLLFSNRQRVFCVVASRLRLNTGKFEKKARSVVDPLYVFQ